MLHKNIVTKHELTSKETKEHHKKLQSFKEPFDTYFERLTEYYLVNFKSIEIFNISLEVCVGTIDLY